MKFSVEFFEKILGVIATNLSSPRGIPLRKLQGSLVDEVLVVLVDPRAGNGIPDKPSVEGAKGNIHLPMAVDLDGNGGFHARNLQRSDTIIALIDVDLFTDNGFVNGLRHCVYSLFVRILQAFDDAVELDLELPGLLLDLAMIDVEDVSETETSDAEQNIPHIDALVLGFVFTPT